MLVYWSEVVLGVEELPVVCRVMMREIDSDRGEHEMIGSAGNSTHSAHLLSTREDLERFLGD